jgi:hypothetical protein
MTRSYLQFNMLFVLHYGSWQRLTYNLAYCLGHIMDHDNGLTYNLTYCLSYIMDHDNGLTYNLTCCLGYIMDHDNGLTYIL